MKVFIVLYVFLEYVTFWRILNTYENQVFGLIFKILFKVHRQNNLKNKKTITTNSKNYIYHNTRFIFYTGLKSLMM